MGDLMKTHSNVVRVAIRKVGTQEVFASLMGVSRQAVQKWCRNGYVPADRVMEFSRLTGVSPENLNKAFEKPKRRFVKASVIAENSASL